MILVTGATGFLGKRVCRKLEQRGVPFMRTSLSLGLDLRNETATVDFFQKAKPSSHTFLTVRPFWEAFSLDTNMPQKCLEIIC